jgi:DNA polymerase-3 subunit delta
MIYFLYGPDSYRLREKVQELIAKYGQGFSVEKIKASELSWEELSRKFASNTLFASKKFLVVSGVLNKEFRAKEELLNFLKEMNFPADEYLVLEEAEADKRTVLFKFLAKKADEAYEFEILKGAEMESWIYKKIKERNLKMSRAMCEKLAAAVLGDSWLAAHELDKLKAYAGEQEITGQMIEDLVSAKFSDRIFELTDALGRKDKKTALRLLENQLGGEDSEIRLLAMIIRQFRIMIQIKSLMASSSGREDKFALARLLGLHHYAVEKTMPLVAQYSFEELKKIYGKLVEIDLKMKSSSVPKAALLNKLVVEL